MNGNLAVRKVPTYKAISIGFNISVGICCSIRIICIVEFTHGNLFLFRMVVVHLLFELYIDYIMFTENSIVLGLHSFDTHDCKTCRLILWYMNVTRSLCNDINAFHVSAMYFASQKMINTLFYSDTIKVESTCLYYRPKLLDLVYLPSLKKKCVIKNMYI